MTFLSMSTIALAAGLTIPPLVALYFLKLKRRVLEVPSTLLWKRAVQDLQVNAPFQRLRHNLLLYLQLLILLLAALALGKPILPIARPMEDTLILMIDQSASMSVVEADGRTRLEVAKEQARRVIDAMSDDARAMVIAYCDRATIVSSFDTDRAALRRRIDDVAPTESLTTLADAVALAEAHAENLIIGGDTAGTDIAPTSAAPPASVILFTDGRVADAAELTIRRLDIRNIRVVTVGTRTDNVGIVSMDARRNYERPEVLQIVATVQNFGDRPIDVDVNLLVDDRHADVQSVSLAAGRIAPAEGEASAEREGGAAITPAPTPPGSVTTIAFDQVMFEGSGVVEVRLAIEDGLPADNRAYTVVPPARHVDVLLVTKGNLFLEKVLSALPLTLVSMTPDEYEAADDDDITDGPRSRHDVVIFDGHSTSRLPRGNYFFWGGVPQIEGVLTADLIRDEIVFDWDESHPVLRYVPVDAIEAAQWSRLILPTDAEVLIDGESAPVLALLTAGPNRYLLCAFRLIAEDDDGEPFMNTTWPTKAHFPVFMYNAVQYLASSVSSRGTRSLRPGEPMSVPVTHGTETIVVRAPDGRRTRIPAAGSAAVHFADTRRVGVYQVQPAPEHRGRFAVTLSSADESDIAPNARLAFGAAAVAATPGEQLVNRPLWPGLLLAAGAILLLEWFIYNRRVYV